MRDSKWQKVDKICYFKWHVLDGFGFGFGFEITIIQTPQNKKKLAKKKPRYLERKKTTTRLERWKRP